MCDSSESKKIRILFVMYSMGMGGSERLVYHLVRRLDATGFESHIAWFSGDKVLPEFGALGVPLTHIPKTRRLDVQTIRQLGQYIEHNEIDVVCAQHFMPAIYAWHGCRQGRGSGLVMVTHSAWEVEELSITWKIVGGWLVRRMDACIGVSGSVSDAIKNAFRVKQPLIHTIENGVDLEAFGRERLPQARVTVLGLHENDRVVGVVGNFKAIKNHGMVLEAFLEVRRRHPSAKLVFVGRGFEGEIDNTEGEIRRFIAAHDLTNAVILVGYRPDVAAVLDGVDVLCLTSLSEGAPLSLIEGMASGLPVVGTNVDGIRGVISERENGMLVELGDSAGLADVLTVLLGDDQQRVAMGKRARAMAEERYSLTRCVREYEILFRSIWEQRMRGYPVA